MKNIITKIAALVTTVINKSIEKITKEILMLIHNPYILTDINELNIYLKRFRSSDKLEFNLFDKFNVSDRRSFLNNVILSSKFALKDILQIEGKNTNKKYWRIMITKSGMIYAFENVRYYGYTDLDAIIFYIKNNTETLIHFMYWLLSNIEMDEDDNNYKNIIGDKQDSKDNINDNILNDIGVDLSKEEIELYSNNREFNIKLNRLQLATDGIENEECNSGYYIIRKVLNSFYTISGLNTLLSLDDEDGEYILCTRDQIFENILPPTQFFVPVAA